LSPKKNRPLEARRRSASELRASAAAVYAASTSTVASWRRISRCADQGTNQLRGKGREP